jgi:catechol 2,3-dioxygenase-like lactoylglutathione lyase family enzyme
MTESIANIGGEHDLGESSGSPDAPFAVVRVGDITLDYATTERFDPHHYAFAVDDATFDATFDAVLGRVRDAGLEYSADPLHREPGTLNANNGGRGFYVRDPDDHNLEFLTRPITG